MTALRRRDFLQISTATFAGTLLSSKTIGDSLATSIKNSQESLLEGTRTPTYCEICFWKCAGWNTKDSNNQPWKVIGNELDVQSAGRLCTRGSAGIGSYLDEDRLKTPLLRVEENGTQKFKPVSWDEALDFIATKLQKIKLEHGAETVAMFNHGTGASFFTTLLRAYGTNMFTQPSYAQCRGARDEAFNLTFGEGIGSPERTDMENARCIVLIGSHLGENLHNSQVQEFAKAIDHQATIITVDPRFSVAASKSKYWLPIKVGTDMALLLAWIHVLIEEKLYHLEFVEKHCLGFQELAEHVKKYSPEWAYPITTIRPEVIRETAREFAKNKPASIIHPSRHVAWDGNDTQRLRAVAILNALLGNWGQKGGINYQNQMKIAEFPIPDFPKPKYDWRSLLQDQYPLATALPSNAVRDLTIEGKFKAWFIYATNLMQALPHAEKTRQAIEKLDLVVAIDTMPAEITGLADVILPECTYLERFDDLRIIKAKKAQVALRMPAFEPRWETKPAWWMAKKLAEKLNLAAYFPWEKIEDYLDHRLRSIGSSLQELQKVGVLEEKNSPSIYVSYDDLHFKTSSQKVELYSKTLLEFGFDPLPTYKVSESIPEDYFQLIYGRSPYHTFGKTINNPILNQLMPENELWVNTAIAQNWGLKQGQYIRLKNQDDIVSNKIKVKITQMIRHDAVYMVHGFGHNAPLLTRAHQKGVDDQQLISKVNVDPIMGSTGFRSNFVTFILDGSV